MIAVRLRAAADELGEAGVHLDKPRLVGRGHTPGVGGLRGKALWQWLDEKGRVESRNRVEVNADGFRGETKWVWYKGEFQKTILKRQKS